MKEQNISDFVSFEKNYIGIDGYLADINGGVVVYDTVLIFLGPVPYE